MGLTKEQIAKRLSELWYMRENNPKTYLSEGYNKIKNDLYIKHGTDDEIIEKANKYFNEMR